MLFNFSQFSFIYKANVFRTNCVYPIIVIDSSSSSGVMCEV